MHLRPALHIASVGTLGLSPDVRSDARTLASRTKFLSLLAALILRPGVVLARCLARLHS